MTFKSSVANAECKSVIFQLHQFSIIFHKNFRDCSLGEYNKLMRKALMWLNLYGCQAVRLKLQKGVKMHFLCFYPFFEVTSDSHIGWATMLSFTSYFLVIPEIFVKKYWECFFESAIFDYTDFQQKGVYKIMRNTVRSSKKCVNHEICVRTEINNKQVAFVTFIDFLSLTELTLHLEKNKA